MFCNFPPKISVLNYNSYRHHHHKKLLMTTTQTQKGGDQNAITTFIRLLNAAEHSVFVLRQDGEEVAIELVKRLALFMGECEPMMPVETLAQLELVDERGAHLQ